MKFPSFLRVAIVPRRSMFDVNITPNGTISSESGTENEILQLLSSGLKFDYKLLAPRDGAWGNLMPNGSWSGTLGMVYRGEADLAIGKIAITEERATILDYSYPYDIEILTFATQIPGFVSKVTAFVLPFSWVLWAAILITLVGIPIVLRALLNRKYNINRLALNVLGHLVHQPLGIKPNSTGDIILLSCWLFGAMTISFSYTAVLLSFLTIPQRERGIRNVHELSDAVCKGSYRCMTFEGDFHAEIFQHSNYPSIKCMGDKIMSKNWKIIPLRETVAKIMGDGQTAVVAPSFFFTYIMQNKVFIAPDSLSPLTRSFFYRKDFCCKEMIDTYIHRITAAGFYERYARYLLYKVNYEPGVIVPVSDALIQGLTVKDMSSAFILLFFGYSLAVGSCVLERYQYRKRNDN